MTSSRTTEEKILERLSQLIEEARFLRADTEAPNHYGRCVGWIAAAQHVTALVLPDEGELYHSRIDEFAEKDQDVKYQVGEIGEVLARLRADLADGLLATIEDQTRAEVFDDFLDHARHYLETGRKKEAGVIAGVVFEDTLRRIGRQQELEEAVGKLDGLISELARTGAFSRVVAKRARAAASVRTSATHAQWDEFEPGDVEATIALTDELILRHLGASRA